MINNIQKMNKFDTLIWRIIGIGIILTISLTLMSFLFIFSKNIFSSISNNNQTSLTNNQKNTEDTQQDLFELSYFNQVGNSDLYLSKLTPRKGHRHSYSKQKNNYRNFYFFNTSTNESYWLFSHNHHVILNHNTIDINHTDPKSLAKHENLPVTHYYFTIDSRPANLKDRTKTPKTHNLYISTADGKSITKILSNLDSSDIHCQYKEMQVFAKRGNQHYYYTIDISTCKITKEFALDTTFLP